MPSKDPRSKNICLISYQNEDYIVNVLSGHSLDIKDFAYILHDKDTDKDGNLKRPHYHILIHLCGSGKSASVVRRWFYERDPPGFQETENTLAQICLNADDMKNYLTHCDAPDKYQYAVEDVKTNNPAFLTSSTENQADNKALEILDDLLSGEISYYDLVKRHGREILINFKSYNSYKNLICFGSYVVDDELAKDNMFKEKYK